MASPAPKRARTEPSYELLYHPGIPGRGEYIRLALEASGTPYSDPANESGKEGYNLVLSACDRSLTRDPDGNPPAFAPPALRISSHEEGKAPLVIHQVPNILIYLGERLGLEGEKEEEKYWVRQLMLTALDLSNETHDTHHPVAVMDYYEDQKQEALKKAKDFRENRIPKFFSYFERNLEGNEKEGNGLYLVGKKLTYADTTFWQVVDGLHFAFPNEMKARSKEFPLIFEKFYPGIKENHLKEYLASNKRLKYSMGLYRHYPELDRQSK